MNIKILLCVMTVMSCALFSQAQTADGVELIQGTAGKSSFLLKDKNGVLWEGEGGYSNIFSRYTSGLKQFKNNGWSTVYPSGIFTDALETDTALFISAYDGVYLNRNGVFSIDTRSTNNTSIAIYNAKIITGTMGDGLYERSSSGIKHIPIVINGKNDDSVICLHASGNDLWIGTPNGLILYDGTTFTRFELPKHPLPYTYMTNARQSVMSIQKDADGKIWVMNNNTEDSLQSIYFLENNQFTEAYAYYSKLCNSRILLPFNAKKFTLSASGYPIIGMGWGILELGKDSIRSLLAIKPPAFNSFYNNNVNRAIAYYAGNDEIYCSLWQLGFAKIKTTAFSNRQLLYDANLATATIDINDIKSTVTNTGINFDYHSLDNPTLGKPQFTVPNISCASAIFTASIWMGGREENSGDLHLAAETYRQIGIDYRPGPIDLVSKTYDSAAASFYNRIWKVDRQTIDEFKAKRNDPFYVIPKSILEWPAHGTGNFSKDLAPFVDVDKNGKYEPVKGDYPLIKGDQMLWWVFNDLATHTETGALSLGVEVHGSCYAYYYRDIPTTDSNAIVNRTLIFNYKIINRSDNNYTEFNTGIWNDVDLGNYADDYVGCDVAQNAGFGYNGYNNDLGPFGFGNNPPMIFCKFLNKKMSSFIYYDNTNEPVRGNPNADIDYYNYLNAKWQNGNNLRFGGDGVNGSIPTKYMFDESTNPSTTFYPCWSERTAGNSPGDRRFLMSSNNGTFSKDSIIDLEFAYILYHDPSKDFSTMACNKPKDALKRVQNWYDRKSFPSRPYYGASVNAVETEKSALLLYPNPANSLLNLKSGVMNDEVMNLQIFDSNGKLIYQAEPDRLSGPFNIGIDIRSFSAGIYLVKVNTVNGTITGKVVVER